MIYAQDRDVMLTLTMAITSNTQNIFQNFVSLYQELLYKYWACLYLFECIFHGDSENSSEIQQF